MNPSGAYTEGFEEYAGMILGKTVARALDAGDVSEAGLWSYNHEYMTTHGYQMASFEVLRRYLQTIPNEQIDYGMKHFLSEEDINDIIERRHPKFNRIQMFNPLLLMRVAGRMELARGLRYTAEKSRALVEHNLGYPETPAGFPAWKKKIVEEIDETKARYALSTAAG